MIRKQLRSYFLFLFIFIFARGYTQNTQTFGTEIFGIFEHIPRSNSIGIANDIERSNILSKQRTANTSREIYRTIDGTYNNQIFRQWGASDMPFRRGVSPAYGPPNFFNDLAGPNRKSARAISNLLNKQNGAMPSQHQLSSFVFTWGQFLDHDITLSGESEEESVPILLPPDEPTFTSPIRFTRSAVAANTGISTPREQKNLITAWIDASNVYGSERSRASWLRTFQGGKLKMSSNKLLPYNTFNGEANSGYDETAPSMSTIPGSDRTSFVAGDVRANEQPGLTALHILFVREHNRYCDELIAKGFSNDERIYQMARQWVGGLMQQITYNEFLPALGIQLNPYEGYHPFLQPDIMNIFATAAFRIGHTMVTDELLLLDEYCENIEASTSLFKNFFNTSLIQKFGIDPIFRGLSAKTQEEVDLKIVDNLRDLLFNIPNAPPAGLDLAALNIQRGRDHGLPDYNTVRRQFLGQRVSSFSQITQSQDLSNRLYHAYNGAINDIDLWVGLLAEDHLAGTSLGPTMIAIMTEQFRRLRDGDYYYFENDPAIPTSVKQAIKNTTLTDIIARNTDFSPSQNIFKVQECQTRPEEEAFCDQVTFSVNDNYLEIQNIKTSNISIKIYNINPQGQYASVYEYVGPVDPSFYIPPFSNGNYKVIFSLFNNNWQRICGPKEQLIQIGGNNPVGSACDQIKIEATRNTVSISNLNATYRRITLNSVNVYTRTLYECYGNCPDKIRIINLTPGKYTLTISLYGPDWAPLCGEKNYVILVSNLGTTASLSSSSRIINETTALGQDIAIFPNPTAGLTNIDLAPYIGKQLQLRIINHTGSAIIEENIPAVLDQYKTFSTDTWPSGMYYVTLIGADGAKISKKLIVK